MADTWQELIDQLYGPVGMDLVERALAHGPEIAEANYPVVLPAVAMDLIGSLALAVNAKEDPQPTPKSPINAIEQLAWNSSARWPFPSKPRTLADIWYITVHHSGTTPRDQTSIEAWHAYHTKTKSWSDIGYHLALAAMKPVSTGGVIDFYWLNPLTQVTWHDTYNYKSVGLVIACDCREGKDGGPNELQTDLFGQAMAWLVPQLPNLRGIVPHKFFQATACPGDWTRWNPRLVDAAGQWGVDIADLVYSPQALSTVQTIRASVLSLSGAQRTLDELQRDV